MTTPVNKLTEAEMAVLIKCHDIAREVATEAARAHSAARPLLFGIPSSRQFEALGASRAAAKIATRIFELTPAGRNAIETEE